MHPTCKKQSSYTWQEKVDEQIREGSRRKYFKATARCNISSDQIVTSWTSWKQVVWKRHGCSRVSHVPLQKMDMKKQVRHGDQPWYPHVLWPLRWTIAHSTWMVPLPLKFGNCKSRSFTSLQMVHTHTNCADGIFLLRSATVPWLALQDIARSCKIHKHRNTTRTVQKGHLKRTWPYVLILMQQFQFCRGKRPEVAKHQSRAAEKNLLNRSNRDAAVPTHTKNTKTWTSH